MKFIKNFRIFEFKEETVIPRWVMDEIARYNDSAGRILNKQVIDYMERFKPAEPITMYRGLGFSKTDAVQILKKLRIDPVVGSKGIYKTGKMQSWAGDEKNAKEFAGLFLFGGLKEKDSLGIVLKATINPDDIAVPIALIPKELKKDLVKFEQNEYILKPGNYQVEVVHLDGSWPTKNAPNLKLLLKKAAEEFTNKTHTKLTRNWNKSSGFAFEYADWNGGPESKWNPNVQVFLEDSMEIKVEVFFKAPTKGFTKKFKDYDAIGRYVQNDLIKDLMDLHNKIKAAAKIGNT